MAEPEDSCTLWSKAENDASWITPEIGPAGTVTGNLNYAAVKFNNGAVGAAITGGVTYNRATVMPDPNKYIYDFWVKWTASDAGWPRAQWFAGDRLWNVKHGFLFGVAATSNLSVYKKDAGGDTLIINLVGQTWNVGDLDHFMFVADNSAGFDGAKTVAIYRNGVQIASWAGAFNITTLHNDLSVLSNHNTGTLTDVYVDNFKIYDDVSASLITDIIANKDTEAWPPPPPPPPPAVVPVTCARSAPRVMVAGHDLVALGYVEEIQPIKQYKTFRRDKLIQNSYRLKVKNFDEFFSLDNPVSQFKDMTWQYLPIQVYNEDDDLDWDGLIEDIPRFHQGKTGAIESVNAFKKYAHEKASYVSSAWETAGDVAKGLMDAAEFTNYDNKSIQDTIAVLTANSCYIKANFQKDSDTNLQQALEKTAEAGAADCYSIKGIVNFKHFTPYTGGVKVNLTTADLKRAPAIRSLTKEIVNNYRIFYSGSETPITDGDAGNIGSVSRGKFFTKDLREMGGKSTDQIIFKDAVSCQYIGEQLIRRSHINLDKANVRAVQEVKFAISIDYREYTDLNTYLHLDFTDEAWVSKLLEIFVFTKNFKSRLIEITAYEAQE